jgi:hypothetical protein
MKKITLLFSLAITSLNMIAQTPVSIPDANFKNYLLANTSINTNSDAEIQDTEAATVTRLWVNNKSISDFTGIEAFTQLTFFSCDSNTMTSLDLHANILLDTLSCAHNNSLAGTFDASTLTSMVRLYLPYNPLLKGFIQSTTPSIKWMDIGGTGITSLDISAQTNLEYLDIVLCTSMHSFNLSTNRKLRTLLIALNPQITALDVSLNDSLTTLTMVNAPGNSAVKTVCVNSTQMAALPNNWTKGTNIHYSTTNCLVGIDELSDNSAPKKLIRIYNILGEEVTAAEATKGIFIFQYNDGSTQKKAIF